MTETASPDIASTRQKLLDGALEQFGRHGFSKTSMADIASAAGISRTSLYKHFPTKDAVFKALSERLNERVYAAVMEAFNAPSPWDDRLVGLIHARVSWVYELLHASEFGRELIDQKNRICGGTVMAANDRFQSMVASLIAPEIKSETDGQDVARVLIQSVNGVLERAETKAEATASVTLLVTTFTRGLMTRA